MTDERQTPPAAEATEAEPVAVSRPEAEPVAASRPEAEPVLVSRPGDGVPPVIDTAAALDAAVRALRSGRGPLAVDAERAQTFRYSAKAYLIQLRRQGAGTFLIDPIAFEDGTGPADLSVIADAVGDAEWIIHAASQDLPCLAEVGMVPRRLFDTELGGRLLGLPKVALTALTERALGKTLAKEHSADDWSKRPLPESWLTYAALDVELLIDVRHWVADQLVAAGKDEWARQEFAALVEHATDAPRRRVDPWRRTSGLHEIRAPRALAVVRELWETRDAVARRLDRAPGRVLPDAAIVELAAKLGAHSDRRLTVMDLKSVRGVSWRLAARFQNDFVAALERAQDLPRSEWPPAQAAPDGPPPPRSWGRRYPEAYARWERMRPATVEMAERLRLPVENLCPPDAVRRLAFEPPAEASEAAVAAFLAERGARPWQVALVAPLLTALVDEPASPGGEPDAP